ncbi:pilus assembly protein [Paenibacillus rhizovicinus]|uniref:Pilus assembly protein n=1 Tax=Paenibacillus rhizovicinus TaxID=2704463 RepID=A0A6C0P3X2_9BACL|nr:pilus assembly protein [Paenibacillus rhizovicinus]QHW33218.1 pilus assembly protein [Paenibacillus rhizovicinus]
MRERSRSELHTDRRRGEAGSIALEASLVLPIALMAVMFFICLIQMSEAQMALHSAVSQTVRQAAANIHPIDLAVQGAQNDSADQAGENDGDSSSADTSGDASQSGGDSSSSSDDRAASGSNMPAASGNTSTASGSNMPAASGNTSTASGSNSSAAGEPLPAVRFLADKLESWLPSPSGPLLAAALRGDWDTIVDTAAATVGRSVIEPMLRHEADTSVLDPERLHLSKISLPDLKNKDDLCIAIEAEYAFKLGFPFTRKTIVLTERAQERVWTPDTLPSPRLGSDADSEHAPIQIVLIEPSPARPGHQARVVVKSSPGRSLSIQVLYKSGRSVARHLGDIVTDGDGVAEWSWLVSGNTTPGTWEIVVTASDGTTAARHFVVQKKPEGEEGTNG